MRKVAGEHSFCVLIYMNSYVFHICFILFILLSYLIFDFVCLTLSSGDTHGIAKYARTYIRDIHTHAHTHKKKRDKVERLEKKWGKKLGKSKKKKDGGSGKKERERKRKDEKKRGGKKEKNERKGGKEKKERKKRKREGDGFRGAEERGY